MQSLKYLFLPVSALILNACQHEEPQLTPGPLVPKGAKISWYDFSYATGTRWDFPQQPKHGQLYVYVDETGRKVHFTYSANQDAWLLPTSEVRTNPGEPLADDPSLRFYFYNLSPDQDGDQDYIIYQYFPAANSWGVDHAPPANFSNALDKITKTNTLSKEDARRLRLALENMLSACPFHFVFDELVRKGIKFNFGLNPRLLAAAFNPFTYNLEFRDADAITAQNLLEELFHALQDQFYPGYGIKNYQGKQGFPNIEFEAWLFRYTVTLLWSNDTPQSPITTSEQSSFFYWLEDFTKGQTTLPATFTPLQSKYFFFIEEFKKSHPEYGKPTDPNLKPDLMLHVFNNSGCKTPKIFK